MRRIRILLLCLAFVAAVPAYATSVTVQMSGEWFQVTDNAGVTDGSIADGGTFTVTLNYDDETPDDEPDTSLGLFVVSAASSSLTLTTGNYSFTLLASETIEISIGDDYFGQDDLGLFAENFTTSGPLPLGVTTGYGYVNPFVVDSSQTAHSSDALASLPWSVSAYDSPNLGMYFLIAVNGAGANKYIELFGDFTDFSVLPEPSLVALMLFGAAALWLTQGRG